MSEGRQGSTTNLTGVWHGIYTYPRPALSVSFVATLIENGKSLSGATNEPCVGIICPSSTLNATLIGTRHDSAVSFVKTYDAVDDHFQDPVTYEGTLSEDATEIEGRWIIRSAWSGKFLMIRSTGKPAAVSRKATERV
jgi:hypothetical protein